MSGYMLLYFFAISEMLTFSSGQILGAVIQFDSSCCLNTLYKNNTLWSRLPATIRFGLMNVRVGVLLAARGIRNVLSYPRNQSWHAHP